jgi:hypothetical protein
MVLNRVGFVGSGPCFHVRKPADEFMANSVETRLHESVPARFPDLKSRVWRPWVWAQFGIGSGIGWFGRPPGEAGLAGPALTKTVYGLGPPGRGGLGRFQGACRPCLPGMPGRQGRDP